MRWVVTGASGLLGRDLVDRLRADGQQVLGLRHTDLDVGDEAALDVAVDGCDVVVNCAAYTDVDGAESDEPAAFAVNAVGPQLVARAAAHAGAAMVHLSTDYVFDGAARAPYAEDHPVRPASAYGRTKAAGEWAVRAAHPGALVVRTAWLYGAGGRCFPRSIAAAAAEREHLDVVDDQVGQPTWSADLADLIVRLVVADPPGGTYHGTAAGRVSWYGFARAVVAATGRDPQMVRPTTSDRLARPAPRPASSVLGHDALRAVGVEPIADWRERWQEAAADVLGTGQGSSSSSR